ncbi:phage distal tail protein, Rcc01695 family [Hyphobacterium sp.]|uniref:phage distal tail protein, Rcc01695 family n=1 Tax=Hyphobacterium sp. TaxID=2004662 RepID=UPI003BAD0F2B
MTSVFHDIQFPFSVAMGASGGPVRRTEIVTLASGKEERNTPWAHSRRRWNASPGIKSLHDLRLLQDFFEARRGQLHGFRFCDPVDNASGDPVSPSDQPLGVGDGQATDFQLIKRYADQAGIYERPIQKPVPGSVRLGRNGEEVEIGMDATVEFDTGKVCFLSPPDAGDVLTAGFRFDVPVRFDTDRLDISLDAFRAGEISDLPLIEILV